MNILYIAHESRLGGANLSLLGLLDELQKKHKVYVVIPIKNGFLADELRKRGIGYFYVHSFWWMHAPASSPILSFLKKSIYSVLLPNNYLCALRLKKIIKKYKIEIIHSNSSVINTGGILAKMTGLPHVWHVREFGQEDFGFFPMGSYKKIYAYISSHSHRVVAISEAIARKVADMIEPEKLQVVYNGVGEEHMYRKPEVRVTKENIRFLISGRISPEKGQEEAVRAMGALKKKGYRNIQLWVAGAGDSGTLRQIAAREGVADMVTFLGPVEDMPSLRKNVDVELVCSRCEAFGRVTVEAMLGSNPVIGTDTGGTRELILEGKTGYLYQPGNIEELSNRMERFLQWPEQIGRMGKKAWEESSGKYTSSRNAREIEMIYKELLLKEEGTFLQKVGEKDK